MNLNEISLGKKIIITCLSNEFLTQIFSMWSVKELFKPFCLSLLCCLPRKWLILHHVKAHSWKIKNMPTLSYLDRVKKKLQNLFKHVQNKIMMMKKKEKLLRFKQLAKKSILNGAACMCEQCNARRYIHALWWDQVSCEQDIKYLNCYENFIFVCVRASLFNPKKRRWIGEKYLLKIYCLPHMCALYAL